MFLIEEAPPRVVIDAITNLQEACRAWPQTPTKIPNLPPPEVLTTRHICDAVWGTDFYLQLGTAAGVVGTLGFVVLARVSRPLVNDPSHSVGESAAIYASIVGISGIGAIFLSVLFKLLTGNTAFPSYPCIYVLVTAALLLRRWTIHRKKRISQEACQ